MSESVVKLESATVSNFKRVLSVQLEFVEAGLFIIGGDNAQGKTSVIDAIIYTLGGERYRPSNLQHEGALAAARVELKLTNGLVVVREGKNATLKVTDPTGARAGQKLLDALIDELALNLPKFLSMKGSEKAGVLLRIIGIGDQLEALEKEERAAYQERESYGRIADQKDKFYKELPWHADVPEMPLAMTDLAKDMQAVMARNATRQVARQHFAELATDVTRKQAAWQVTQNRVLELEKMLADAKSTERTAVQAYQTAMAAHKAAQEAPIDADETTAEIEAKMQAIEEINGKVRQNLDKAKAKEDAEACTAKYTVLTGYVEDVRKRRRALLDGATMPLPGLSVEAGELTYNGKAWDCMSGSEQIKVGIAIVRKLKPSCGFVLLDKLEAFDDTQIEELRQWFIAENLLGIGTRVSKGKECSIIIEDGQVVGATEAAASDVQNKEMEW